MTERIELESLGLFCSELADVLVGREAFEGLEAPGEVVGADEVGEMGSELVVGLVVEVFDNCLLDRAVHALDLSVGSGMFGLGEAMIDIVLSPGQLKGVRAPPRAPTCSNRSAIPIA